MTTPTIVTTSRPRAGRRFTPTHELALERPALDACRALPGAHQGLIVVREMVGPIGIPDFTALVGDPAALLERRLLDVPPLLNEADSGIVSAAHPSIGRTTAMLARRLRWSEESVGRRLPNLLRCGALREVAKKRYVRPPQLRPLGRIYAVEAKVRDGKSALRQARLYNVWADAYVVVMGALSAGVSSRIDQEVAKDGGGLVVDGRWRRRARVGKVPTSRRLWAAEHVVAAMQDNVDYAQPSDLA